MIEGKTEETALARPGDEAPKHRVRHDGFTPLKQRRFLKALKKSGCIKDACRAAEISKTTVSRHRDRFPGFAQKVDSALAIAAEELDMIAWKRATEGAEETITRGGEVVAVRRKPSDAMLRLLMQGANPRKYGRSGGFAALSASERLRIKAKLRAEVEQEVRADIAAEQTMGAEPVEELRARLVRKIQKLRQRIAQEKLAEGYTVGPLDILLPPGWRIVVDETVPGAVPLDWRPPEEA